MLELKVLCVEIDSEDCVDVELDDELVLCEVVLIDDSVLVLDELLLELELLELSSSS